MSGTPGSDRHAKYPSWVVNPWNGVELEVLEYQKSVVDPFWREMDLRAQDAGAKLALELHPHNLVFTPVNFLEFAERIDARNIGVNMDPSHLMWQGMDIIAAIELLGDHIFHVHAKDTVILPGIATRGCLTRVLVRYQMIRTFAFRQEWSTTAPRGLLIRHGDSWQSAMATMSRGGPISFALSET